MNPLQIIGITIGVLAALALVAMLIIYRIRPRLYKPNTTPTSASGKVKLVTPVGGTPYLIKYNADGSVSDAPFKILTCADMHNKSENSEFTFTVFARLLDKEQPDLVVLLGDNVVGRSDTQMQEKLKNFFEKRRQFWGFVLGNHDNEYKTTLDFKEAEKRGALSAEQKNAITAEGRKWMFNSLIGGAHCVVFNECGSGVHGAGNCVINIKNTKGISQSLFFFDSGDYVYGIKRKAIGSEVRCYDYVRRNQLDWYSRRLAEIKAENGGILPKSTAFFHIPLPEYQKAFNMAMCKIGGARLINGNNFEHVCCSDINDGAFEAFCNSGSTHITVCGHDHKNDSSVLYRGVRLTYSQGLQFDGAYNRRKKSKFFKLINKINPKLCCFTEGVTLLTVYPDGKTEIGATYAQKEKVFYGLEKYYDSAFLTGTEK